MSRLYFVAGLLFLSFGLLVSSGNAQAKLPESFTVAQPNIPNHVLSLASFGVVGDGKTLDTDAFKKAVAAVEAAGGGKLEVPAGIYLTAPFQLTSNLNLHLLAGATIKFTDDRSKFKLTEGGYEICISAEKQHDIAITGSGTIDGSGQSWWTEFKSYRSETRDAEREGAATAPAAPPHRPYMIMLTNCDRVLLQGVTLTNSPMFHFVPKDCTEVTVDGVTIKAPSNSPNTDGIDPSGQNYHIMNCSIDTGDDNIALKPHPAEGGHAGCENFLIENMTFGHGHGMSIGGGSHGGVRNMLVRNCTFTNTDFGVRMKAGRDRGGVAERLTYENLKMTDVGTAILIISYYPSIPADIAADASQPVTDHTPVWKDILIRNVQGSAVQYGCRIVGLPEQHVGTVKLENVDLKSSGPAAQIIRADDVQLTQCHLSGKPNQIIDSKVTGLK